MSKLTLSVDPTVVAQAKRYAKQSGVSISELVETYLSAVSGTAQAAATLDPPILRSVRGCLKRAAVRDYKKHLEAKYR